MWSEYGGSLTVFVAAVAAGNLPRLGRFALCTNGMNLAGGQDLWQVPIFPIVDFNADGVVDLKDFARLAPRWRQYERSVDVGPTPLGDGIVDVRDLAVLGENWLADLRVIAHWKLDEAVGAFAQDSAGGYTGTLHGDPVWRPQGGKIGGALQLDGVDDHVTTDLPVDPGAGPFSVFAWVKGGAPGQVILSQSYHLDWLSADPADGHLRTNLREAGRGAKALVSAKTITDGAWHRVGLVWDRSSRVLYVDGVEAATDTQRSLAASTNGLYLGAGSTLAPGSFWSGLIDDVRLYNRAIKP